MSLQIRLCAHRVKLELDHQHLSPALLCLAQDCAGDRESKQAEAMLCSPVRSKRRGNAALQMMVAWAPAYVPPPLVAVGALELLALARAHRQWCAVAQRTAGV
jgi:hypothetical protein